MQNMSGNTVYTPITPPQGSGVNIVIYNPSVNPAASMVNNSANNYAPPPPQPQSVYPQNYYIQQPQPISTSAVANAYTQPQPPAQIQAAQQVQPVLTPIAAPPKPAEEKITHKQDIVQITDEYVKTLENYLNNPNTEIRKMGVKELMERFKEHKSRSNDIALVNLLNKCLQDKSKEVRFLAMTTLDAGWCQGDGLTRQILTKIQSSKDVYGEDALLASDILLKLAGTKVQIDVEGPAPEKKSEPFRKAQRPK